MQSLIARGGLVGPAKLRMYNLRVWYSTRARRIKEIPSFLKLEVASSL